MRTLVIALRALPFALSFRRDAKRWLVGGAPLPRSAAFHARRAERLAATVAALGPSFVKLAQVFAARADIIPEPYLSALGALLDRVPAAPWSDVAAGIERSYGRPVDAIFQAVDREPVASGSRGQVYRARYEGQDVAVKVLRPGVEHVVERDLDAAFRIVQVIERRWPNPHVVGFRTTIEEFRRRVPDEMDFRLEADHAREIGGRFAGDRRLVIPRVLPELTRQRVMVMEFVEGTRVDRLAPLVAAGRVDATAMVREVLEAYVRMMLMDGLFHADPHPGNLLVTDDGRLVLLDFGMCVRVSAATRTTLVRTVLAAIRKDAGAVADGFHALGIVAPGADPEEIRRLTQLLLDLAFSGAAPQEAARVLAEEVMKTLYDWPIVLTGEMVYFARAAALIEGLGMRYVPGFSPIAFASPIVLRMRGQILAALRGGGADAPAAWGGTPDWAAALGDIAGRAARIISGAGRELAAVVGTGLAELVAAASASNGARANGATNGNGAGHGNGVTRVAPNGAPRLPAVTPPQLPAGELS
jgi:predicted unusual protein kinase regulating ubiquinone biosynthesis (AarF/ABC1/UbiB family)